ncbi:hypothetical protein IM997_004768 [Salmonella enterica]|nr:hypothetical protein [Salmonella enterica]
MVTHKTLKRSLLALSVAASLVMAPTGAIAANGLQSQMDKLFNEMSNTTPPGVYESQRRGVLAGGRFTAKTRIFDENLVSFAPPSWKAGCGGVDLFGGSLSFINADQIVQLLRAVAANAKGYAFQLALDNVFPDGAKWIENFQKKVQALNQHLGNSCQLAQGFVNDLTSGMDLKHKTDASITATTSGLYEDFFGSKQETSGKSPLEELKANKPDEYNKMIGNIVWKQLKSNNANTWFQYGDNTLLEAIMSLTGTVIIGDLVNDPNLNQYGDEFKETMQSIAQSRYGLTESQAAVYAESFDTNEGRMNQAVQNLKMEYAERNPDGSPMMQGGQPVLSQQNEEFTDKLVNVLQNSTEAGDRSGSYLTAVRGYNIANQRF